MFFWFPPEHKDSQRPAPRYVYDAEAAAHGEHHVSDETLKQPVEAAALMGQTVSLNGSLQEPAAGTSRAEAGLDPVQKHRRVRTEAPQSDGGLREGRAIHSHCQGLQKSAHKITDQWLSTPKIY